LSSSYPRESRFVVSRCLDAKRHYTDRNGFCNRRSESIQQLRF
jgi:hypothetical protein